jgi:hypothetical protein
MQSIHMIHLSGFHLLATSFSDFTLILFISFLRCWSKCISLLSILIVFTILISFFSFSLQGRTSYYKHLQRPSYNDFFFTYNCHHKSGNLPFVLCHYFLTIFCMATVFILCFDVVAVRTVPKKRRGCLFNFSISTSH